MCGITGVKSSKQEGITFEQGAAFPHSDGASGSILAQTQLHEEEWDARKKKHYEVGDEKHTCED